MYILIAGAGQVGRFLALSLEETYSIGLIDLDEANLETVKNMPNIATYTGDATSPADLETAGILKADIVVAVTGDDEDNLVISQLAKEVYKTPRVIGRINDPRNQWLFDEKWGVDVAVSSPQIILQLISEELSLSDVVTLLKLKVGKLSLVEVTVSPTSPAHDKKVKNIGFPRNAVAVALLRDTSVIVPHGETTIRAGDSVLLVTRPELEQDIRRIFVG
ncbi:MAG: NAD-binding protein [Candidatus Aquicultor sp.]|nr:NAD-binding protein [Candidatus Aquicultor sp.]